MHKLDVPVLDGGAVPSASWQLEAALLTLVDALAEAPILQPALAAVYVTIAGVTFEPGRSRSEASVGEDEERDQPWADFAEPEPTMALEDGPFLLPWTPYTAGLELFFTHSHWDTGDLT